MKSSHNGGQPSHTNFGEERSIQHQYNVNPNHITPGQFTESDRRAVMEKFLGNKEILFLIYGLMFPL